MGTKHIARRVSASVNVAAAVMISLIGVSTTLYGQDVTSAFAYGVAISNVQVTGVTQSAVTITWSTNVAADSTILYGTALSYGSQVHSATFVTQHSLTITNLAPGTVYDFQVQSRGTQAAARPSNSRFQTSATPSPSSASLWTEIAADMNGAHEGHPHGVPLSWDWANGPVVLMGNNPNGWSAVTAWGAVYEAAEGNPATNSRVNLRNMQTFFLQRSTGKWLLLQNTSHPAGDAYLEDFSGDISKPADVRSEPDGTISVTAGGGYNFHFYPADRASINPNDVGGFVVVFEARLIVGNPSQPDDRSIARYLAGAGADYYPALTGGWPGNLSYNPGMAIGKMKYVQSEWRFYSMTTLTADQLRSNPPPLALSSAP